MPDHKIFTDQTCNFLLGFASLVFVIIGLFYFGLYFRISRKTLKAKGMTEKGLQGKIDGEAVDAGSAKVLSKKAVMEAINNLLFWWIVALLTFLLTFLSSGED